MTCKDCINYQKTQLKTYPTNGDFEHSDILFDCPFADDWCEYDTPINVLCDNKFEPKEKEQN